ncbi:MAG: ABC transporter substrate-binding protein [Candidatus Woesearchaeota archaeon]|nr:ABC transporter substrate-binding protein [Candidatus Woesearchaeota archaeon]
MKILVALVLIIMVIGCARQKQAEEVDVALKWLHQAQFAGVYVAKDKGFYDSKGLDVKNIYEFDFNQLPIDMVQSKKVDFAVAGADELILAKSEGRANNVKAIAVIYKTNPVCLYSLQESGISSPQDFIGKTVGIERTADGKDINVGVMYYAMMSNLGINRSRINEVSIGFDDSELLEGKVDVSSGYIINEPNLAKEKEKKIITILPSDYGVNMYADVIIANEDMMAKNPQLVENFLRATLEGWQYAIEHEEEAVDIVMAYAKDSSREHQASMLRSSIPLISSGDSQLGMMSQRDWEGAQRILFSQQLIKSPIGSDNLYELRFLKSIYGNQDASEKIPVSVKLIWLHQNQFAGFYAADKLGYYDSAGLDVTLNSAGYGAPVWEQVEAGRYMFGIMHAHEFIKAVSGGARLKAVAAIYDADPVVFISLKSKNITSPRDLKGKTLAFTLATPERIKIALMKAGIDYSDVNPVQKRYGIESLHDKEVDVLVGTSFNEQLLAEEENLDVDVMNSSELGIGSYANVIFTTDNLISDEPELIRKFVTSSVDGWGYVLENPMAASGFVFDYDNGLNPRHEDKMILASNRLIDSLGIGHMDGLVWQSTIDDLYDVGEIDKKMDARDLFTNEFMG